MCCSETDVMSCSCVGVYQAVEEDKTLPLTLFNFPYQTQAVWEGTLYCTGSDIFLLFPALLQQLQWIRFVTWPGPVQLSSVWFGSALECERGLSLVFEQTCTIKVTFRETLLCHHLYTTLPPYFLLPEMAAALSTNGSSAPLFSS